MLPFLFCHLLFTQEKGNFNIQRRDHEVKILFQSFHRRVEFLSQAHDCLI